MKYFVFFLSMVLFSFFSKAQVAITDIDTVSTVDSSAILDLSSENRGFLPPRMNTTKIDSIDSPAEGLVVYNTTLGTLMYFNGSDWALMRNMDGESCGSVTYEGQTYETVIIGKQCWMAENLNVGWVTVGSMDQTDNSMIERYCYDNEVDSCAVYGGLYQWAEMVQYLNGATNTTSWDPVPTGHVQGICPPGWHIPSDDEWKTMEGNADTQYGVGDPEWDGTGSRGYDAGKRLKSTTRWVTNTGTNAFGFTALPGGYRSTGGSFGTLGSYGYWWSSTEDGSSDAWTRYLYYINDDVLRYYYNKDNGFSVRCLKD